MIKPVFFIKSVTTTKAKNAAQEFVLNEVRNLDFMTLDDAATLNRFERYLNTVVKSAHELHPRCKVMVIEKSRTLSHEHQYRISNQGDTQYVVIISIATNRGPWKGGLL